MHSQLHHALFYDYNVFLFEHSTFELMELKNASTSQDALTSSSLMNTQRKAMYSQKMCVLDIISQFDILYN